MKNNKEMPIIGLLFFLILLLTWEILSRLNIIDILFLPPPSQILVKCSLLYEKGFLIDLFSTLYKLLFGFILGVFISVPLGILMGISKFINRLLEFTVEIMRPIPASALIPLSIILLGIGNSMTIFIIAYAVVWPILINTIDGVKNVDPILIDTGKIFRLSKKELLYKIIIPASLPSIFTGMRISLAVSIVLVIVVEMLIGNDGLGFRLLNAERTFQFDEMYFVILLTGILGYVLNFIYTKITKHFISWHINSKLKEF